MPDKIIEKVLYGKPVIVEEVYNFRRALLVDGYNDFVAFVTLRRRNRGTEIIPVLDIGWYLRAGANNRQIFIVRHTSINFRKGEVVENGRPSRGEEKDQDSQGSIGRRPGST